MFTTVNLQFFPRRKINEDFNVYVNHDIIYLLVQARFLGFPLDANMAWKSNINYVWVKLNKAYFAILQLKNTCYTNQLIRIYYAIVLKNTCSTNQLIHVYYAIVNSHMSYNIALWGGSSGSVRIFIPQKRILDQIFGIKSRDTCKQIFKDQTILTFPCVNIFKCVIYIKKNLNFLNSNSQCHKLYDYFEIISS